MARAHASWIRRPGPSGAAGGRGPLARRSGARRAPASGLGDPAISMSPGPAAVPDAGLSEARNEWRLVTLARTERPTRSVRGRQRKLHLSTRPTGCDPPTSCLPAVALAPTCRLECAPGDGCGRLVGPDEAWGRKFQVRPAMEARGLSMRVRCRADHGSQRHQQVRLNACFAVARPRGIEPRFSP